MLDRRQFIGITGAALLAQCLSLPRTVWASGRNHGAFSSHNLQAVYDALGLPRPEESPAIHIDVPDVSENGANVAIEVSVRLPGVERLLLIAESNSFPLLADVSFSKRSEPWIETRVKLADSTRVRVIVQANGNLYASSRQVQVIAGGCL